MNAKILASLLLLGALCAVETARAAPAAPPSQEEMERAHAAYDQAQAAYQLGHFAEAAAKYEQVYRIIQFPNFLFDTAQAERRWYETEKDLPHLRRALELYRSYLREAPPTGNNRVLAQRLIPQLEQVLATETRRQREELIAQAAGTQGVFIADQILAEGAPAEAALALDHVLASRNNPREATVGAIEKRLLIAGLLGEADRAVELCQRALVLDPGFLLAPESAEVARRGCDEARTRLGDRKPLTLRHVARGDARHGETARVAVAVETDPLGMVEAIAVMYRRSQGGAFTLARAAKDAQAVEVPEPFTASVAAGTKIDYYVVALDGNDNELVTVGSAKEPFQFVVTPSPEEQRLELLRAIPPPKPLWKKGWFWGVLASWAAAATAGVAIGVVATRRSPPDWTITYNGP